MKVVLYEPSGCGGIFHYTFELAESLSRTSLDVTVLTQEDHELGDLTRTFAIKGRLGKSQIKSFFTIVKTRALGRRSRRSGASPTKDGGAHNPGEWGRRVLAFRRLAIWLELVFDLLVRRPQIIHFQWLSDPERDYSFLKTLKLVGFKIVYTAHNLLPHTSASDDKKNFQRIYALVDRIIVHAVRNKEEMVEVFGISPSKISVIPHGAYRLFYGDKSTTREQAREELGIPGDKRIILFFGSIRRYKGLEYLVDAFRIVREKLENVMLLIVGEVPPAGAEEVARYSKFMAEVGIEDDVLCRRGYIEVEKVGYYFSASDLVVLPYVKTYQSGVLLLAYAAGRPVVATDTGGLGEVVEEGKSGFVVSPRNVERLAEAIISVISDPNRAEEMGRYAKYLAESKYSWDEVARKTLEVYQSVIYKTSPIGLTAAGEVGSLSCRRTPAP